MRIGYIVGVASTVLFAVLMLYSLSSNPPIYSYWGRVAERLVPFDLVEIGRSIGEYVWVYLFPALIGVLLSITALIVGISMLLRRD